MECWSEQCSALSDSWYGTLPVAANARWSAQTDKTDKPLHLVLPYLKLHVLKRTHRCLCDCAAVLLQYKIDKDGANIGVLFDNRVRPQQYSKPGAGYAGGLHTMETL
jgi:hypothetical protein